MKFAIFRMNLLLIIIFSLSFTTLQAISHGATLAWNANNEEDLAGYKLYYIASSGENGRIDVGNVTEYELSFLMEAKDYYLSLTAYDTSGNESKLSMPIYYFADDGIPYNEDNCPHILNPDQTDTDGDGHGDACDDSDSDGIFDSVDNCPDDYNPDQEDTMPPGGNNCGDACECEVDIDHDGDVDGLDALQFKLDWGREDCPLCQYSCY